MIRIQFRKLQAFICLILLTFSATAMAEKVVVMPLLGGDVSGVITRTNEITFPGLNNGSGLYLSATALCNEGEHVLGGGYNLSNRVSVNSQPNVIVVSSRPAAANGSVVANGGTARGWFVDARQNSTASATTVTVSVQCLAV